MTILEGSFLFTFSPKDFVIAIRVKRWVYVNQVNRSIRQLLELLKAVAAVDDLGVKLRRHLLRPMLLISQISKLRFCQRPCPMPSHQCSAPGKPAPNTPTDSQRDFGPLASGCTP